MYGNEEWVPTPNSIALALEEAAFYYTSLIFELFVLLYLKFVQISKATTIFNDDISPPDVTLRFIACLRFQPSRSKTTKGYELLPKCNQTSVKHWLKGSFIRSAARAVRFGVYGYIVGFLSSSIEPVIKVGFHELLVGTNQVCCQSSKSI